MRASVCLRAFIHGARSKCFFLVAYNEMETVSEQTLCMTLAAFMCECCPSNGISTYNCFQKQVTKRQLNG